MFYLDNKLKYYTQVYIIMRNKTRNYYNYCFILYYCIHRYGYFNHSLS